MFFCFLSRLRALGGQPKVQAMGTTIGPTTPHGVLLTWAEPCHSGLCTSNSPDDRCLASEALLSKEEAGEGGAGWP